jgi:hypothetical protein
MPHKDPEQRKEANKERMRRKRAAGEAWIDPAKEAARKAAWYFEKGGKQHRLESDRRRLERLREQKISDIRL